MSERSIPPKQRAVAELGTVERMEQWEALADLEALQRALTPDEAKRKAQLAASLPELAAEERCYDVLQSALQGAPRLAPADDPLIRAALRAVELERTPLENESEPAMPKAQNSASGRALFGGRVWLIAAALMFTIGGLVFVAREVWQRPAPADVIAARATAPAIDVESPAVTPRDLPRLLLATGEVRIDAVTAMSGTQLAAGARLQTLAGQACFGMDRGVVVCMGSQSEVVLAALGDSQRVELQRGRVAARLGKQPPGTDFGILTAAGSAIAVGTAFAVELDSTASKSNATRLRVLEGTVRAVTAKRQLLVEQAQELDFANDAVSTLDADAAGRDRALLAATQLWARGAENRLVLSTDPPNASVMLDNVVLGQTPLSVDVQPGRHELDVQAAGFASVVRTLSFAGAAITEHIVLTPAAAGEQPRASEAAHPAAASSAAAGSSGADVSSRAPAGLLEQARGARAAGRYADAAVRYRELLQRYPGSAEASAALLSLAELELTQLGNPTQALDLYGKYLQRGGNLGQEAHYGRVRALRALGRSAEEERESAAFLRKYPDSAYAAALKRRQPAP